MASPTVATTAHSNSGGAIQNHVITLPAGVASGDLLVVFFSFGLNGGSDHSPTWPSGWTQIINVHMTGGAYEGLIEARTRVADGSEGASITITTTPFVGSAWTVYRITGHNSGITPEATTAQDPTGADEFLDPPSITPTGGSKDYLFLSGVGAERGRTVSTAPTNYSNLLADANTVADNVYIGTAQRQLTASSEDPGTFTISAVSGGVTWTVAVHPATAGTAYDETGRLVVVRIRPVRFK